jgi:hypothetical protein
VSSRDEEGEVAGDDREPGRLRQEKERPERDSPDLVPGCLDDAERDLGDQEEDRDDRPVDESRDEPAGERAAVAR